MPIQYQLVLCYPPLGQSRFRVDRVNPAAARETLQNIWRPPGRLQGVFGGRYRGSRVFLAAANLTLESFWGRVILACYTGLTSFGLLFGCQACMQEGLWTMAKVIYRGLCPDTSVTDSLKRKLFCFILIARVTPTHDWG
ncbi:hypothetical protein PoB_002132500 [Plakobranchus ocellatus]|uniref:Uncharacterized protein n=1 Tax=Plakobranchus ocellatus TaxID=259542 RepID=A0AAV3ZGT8_9GAST|nr:hypothetical protein PoB_002132500 [Plakobranchus ocellatus]